MRNIIIYLRGSCCFSAEGNFPERFLNLCARADMGLWDIHRTENGLCAKIIASRYGKLRPIAKKCGVKLRVKNKYGLPFRLLPYRKRAGMPLGLILFAGLIWFLGQFIWFVDIPQVSPALQDKLEAAVYDAGIRPGMLRSRIDAKMISTELQLEINELSWAGISTLGSSISVDVREMEKMKKVIENTEPCNVIAAKDGVIISVNSSEGQNEVSVGQAVQKGDLLISGVMEHQDGAVSMVHAQGEVFAAAYYELCSEVNYMQHKKERTGKMITIRRVMLLGVEIPLYLGKMPSGDFERECSEWQLSVSNTDFPFIVRTEHWYELLPINREISATQAEAQAYADIEQQIKALDNIDIISRTEEIEHTEKGVILKVILTSKEDIAAQELILFEQ